MSKIIRASIGTGWKTFGVFMLSLILSCDDTLEQLQEDNEAPVVTFTYLENNISILNDSIKFFSNLSKNNYEQDITVTDAEGNLREVYYKVTSGSGRVITADGITQSILQPALGQGSGGIYSFTYQPSELGYHEVLVYARDLLDEYDTLQMRLTVFDNLPPKAALDVNPSRVVSKYEYIIDGSGSIDGDARFGGEIELYRFTINSQVIDLEEPSFPYVFGGEQIVNIRLKVQDSNGVWSEEVGGVYSID